MECPKSCAKRVHAVFGECAIIVESKFSRKCSLTAYPSDKRKNPALRRHKSTKKICKPLIRIGHVISCQML